MVLGGAQADMHRDLQQKQDALLYHDDTRVLFLLFCTTFKGVYAANCFHAP